MKTYELFAKEDKCMWITGEIIRTSDPLQQGNTQWEIYWEGGSFVFFGGKHQLKATLKRMKPELIIGKEK